MRTDIRQALAETRENWTVQQVQRPPLEDVLHINGYR